MIDFMRLIHELPPPDVYTLGKFLECLWQKNLLHLGFARGATQVTVVIDKPQFLPLPRALLAIYMRETLEF